MAVVARRGCAAKSATMSAAARGVAQADIEADGVHELARRRDVRAGHDGRQPERREHARRVGRVVRAVAGVAVPADDAGTDQPLAAAEILAAADADQIRFFQSREIGPAERGQQRRGRVRVAGRDLDEPRADDGTGLTPPTNGTPKPASLPCADAARTVAEGPDSGCRSRTAAPSLRQSNT